MPCGTSSVVSTTPATMSLPSHARWYDVTACNPGTRRNADATARPGSVTVRSVPLGPDLAPHPRGVSDHGRNHPSRGDDACVTDGEDHQMWWGRASFRKGRPNQNVIDGIGTRHRSRGGGWSDRAGLDGGLAAPAATLGGGLAAVCVRAHLLLLR